MDSFNKYSQMTVINRQNLDTVLDEQVRSVDAAYSDQDYIDIGKLVNAQYILAGTIIKIPGGEFSLQFGVTNTETGVRLASFTRDCASAVLERGTVLNEAAAALLESLGVELNAAEKQTLLASTASTDAETARAHGIVAQKQGNVLEALNYFYQAASFDPSLADASLLIDRLASTATGDEAGQMVLTDYQSRMAWLDLLKQCAVFYQNHPPFDVVYDPAVTQGDTNYADETLPLSFNIRIAPVENGLQVLNELLARLDPTGNRSKWGFAGWPLLNVEPVDRDAVVFGGARSFRFDVEAALIDSTGKTIGTDRFSLTSGSLAFSSGARRIDLPAPARSTVTFRQVSVLNYTQPLSIRITKVNGNAAESAVENGYMRILTQAEYDVLPDVIAQRRRK